MTNEFGTRKRASSAKWTRWADWTAYAACGWAFLFAALSFFWAAGGRTGLHPLEQAATSSRTTWIAISLGTGTLKAIAGLMALALIRSHGRSTYRGLLFAATWVLGVGMFLYGGLGLVSDVLHVTDVISSDPETRKWFFWYLVLWDPWWMLGGALYAATSWLTRRRDVEIGANRGISGKAAVGK